MGATRNAEQLGDQSEALLRRRRHSIPKRLDSRWDRNDLGQFLEVFRRGGELSQGEQGVDGNRTLFPVHFHKVRVQGNTASI